MKSAPDRKKIYGRKAKKFAAAEAEEESKSNRMSNLRMAAFSIILICGVIGTLSNFSPMVVALWFLASGVALVVFVRFVILHRRITARLEKFGRLRELNEFAMHRLNRAWSKFPVPVAPSEFANQNVAHDLDLFGPASIFQLVCFHNTPQGRFVLAQWLTEPGEPEELLERQASVEALSDQFDWRQELSVMGTDLSVDDAVILPEWITVPQWLNGKMPWLHTYLKWSPWLFLALLAFFFTIFPFPGFVIVLGFNIYITRKYRNEITRSLKSLSGEERKLGSYSEIFRWLETCQSKDGRLEDLKNSVSEAAAAMDQLNDLVTKSAVRGSIVHPLLMGVALWDFRVVSGVEKWQASYGKRVDKWFQALGEFEAVASLAGLRFDEPDWAFPTFKKSGTMEGAAVGHPLIGADLRVANLVRIGPEGRFLLVTGSNMSGKSTLLRSIGLNVTLAQAGGPVCATEFSLPRLAIATSMRVQDSLADGVSFFLAELKRIKEVVLQAGEFREKDRNVLFLLDEILQGTNTVERREIVQRVIAHLVECGAIGAVTTHDLALAEMDDLTRNADLIHFRETFSRDAAGKPEMTFDYQLREGIATTTNALKILEVIEMPV